MTRNIFTGRNLASRKKMSGLTLIELLIGLVVSTFLLLAVSSYFTQSKSTFNYQRSQADQLQSERFVSFVIGNTIRQAGYAPLNEDRLQGLGLLFPAAGPFAVGQYVTGTNSSHDVAVNGENALQTYPNDTLSVRYVGAPGINRCSGVVTTDGDLLVDTFSVDGVHLNCDTVVEDVVLLGADDLDTTQQTRVLGMDVLYGEDLDGNNSADIFVDADAIDDWRDVLTAQVELFIQSGSQRPQNLRLQLVFENVFGADQL